MTVEEFIQALKAQGIELSDKQIAQFARYYTTLVEWNDKMNLTAITDEAEVYLKHFYDSLMPLWLTEEYIPIGAKLVDVGAGAGFPSIPLKIVRPDLEITIVDSLNKRITFLNHLSDQLELDKVMAVHGRAEEVGQNPQYRQQFDIATARAVAALNILSELCLPLVKKGGHFIALKGQRSEDEVQQAKQAIRLLGGKLVGQFQEHLPKEDSIRDLVVIKKTLETPNKYPRKAGKPNKQPL